MKIAERYSVIHDIYYIYVSERERVCLRVPASPP